jgi:carboxymethylenebutenolidase
MADQSCTNLQHNQCFSNGYLYEVIVIKKQHIVLENSYEGYLFCPAHPREPTQCVIVFHERYGLVQHTFDVCTRLAKEGYLVLAPDLFSLWDGDKESLKRGEVRAIVSDKNCREQLDIWLDYMKAQSPDTNDLQVILMGVCQSGRYPIVVASERTDITACVIFYGAAHDRDWAANKLQPLSMPLMIEKLTTPILFVFAERDHTISMENVSRVRAAIEATNLSYRMKVIPEVPHGFLNDTMPGRYRPEQAEEAWRYLLRFLTDVFDGGWPKDNVEWELQCIRSKTYNFAENTRME